jgi:hypothetical protein
VKSAVICTVQTEHVYSIFRPKELSLHFVSLGFLLDVLFDPEDGVDEFL